MADKPPSPLQRASEPATAGPMQFLSYNDDDAAGSQARDRLTLARLGKKQVLKRRFGFLPVAGFSCTILITWEALLELFTTGLKNGGPAGLIYGYILVWIGTLATFITISELASMAPTAGGQYHWVYMLSPTHSRKFLSYLTGWLTSLGWQTAITSSGFLSGGIIQGLVILHNPDYAPEKYQATLIGYACILVAVFVNTVVSSHLPRIESIVLFLHILGFLIIVIIVGYMAPHGTPADVFLAFANGGGWSTQGLSFFIGIIGNVYAFTGADAAVHMAEEIKNAQVVLPRAIILSILLSGAMGLIVMIVMLFGIGDADAVLNTPTEYPFIQIFLQATNSPAGTTALSAIIVASVFFSCLGFIATSSRMIWSFARDRALPFSGFLSKVNPRNSIPIRSVIVTTLIGSVLLLINIGSTIALNILLSINIFAFYTTYLLCCALLLWNRCTNQIGPCFYHSGAQGAGIGKTSHKLNWGPFHVSGWLGIAINAFAVGWTLTVIFFSFWPVSMNPTLLDMNWSIVISGFSVTFSVGYYILHGRKNYTGPVVDQDLLNQPDVVSSDHIAGRSSD